MNKKYTYEEFLTVKDEYLRIVKQKNDHCWRERESKLYYSVKNRDCVLPCMVTTVAFMMFDSGWIVSVFCIMLCLCVCISNNEKLNDMPEIKKQRLAYFNLRVSGGYINE